MSLYEDLGVASDASAEQINAAYRRAAKRHHPDAGGDPEAFGRLQRAVSVLRDPGKRQRYDTDGTIDDGATNEQAEIVDALVQAFQTAMASARDVRRFDVIKATDERLAERLNAVKAERSQALELQRQNAEALTRLKRRGKGPDFIRKALEDRATAVGQALGELDRRQKVVEAARELAKGYSWQVDAAPEQAGFFAAMPAVGAWKVAEWST